MHMSTGRRPSRAARLVVTVAAVALLAAACGTTNNGGGGSSSGGERKIALLLPESKTTRYEAQDRPLFQAKVKALCSDCQILYSNANQDAAAQQNQADAALTNGAKVLVLDPVDSASAASIVSKAKAQNVPVISYDRLITGADVDYYISFDNVEVGKLQARSLVSKLKADGEGSGTIVMINGAPTDNNAKLFKQGAHSVLDTSGLKIGKEYDTPLLELRKVSKRFGAVQALTDVDFSAQAGRVTALVGDNGAGKSTLIKIISGIVDADSGT
jgi:D-xylose transport system substrate-binding protein